MPNYPVILSHRRSTTVSLETYPLDTISQLAVFCVLRLLQFCRVLFRNNELNVGSWTGGQEWWLRVRSQGQIMFVAWWLLTDCWFSFKEERVFFSSHCEHFSAWIKNGNVRREEIETKRGRDSVSVSVVKLDPASSNDTSLRYFQMPNSVYNS